MTALASFGDPAIHRAGWRLGNFGQRLRRWEAGRDRTSIRESDAPIEVVVELTAWWPLELRPRRLPVCAADGGVEILRLVGVGFLVHSETDAVYRPWRGAVYGTGQVKSSFAGETELWFYVAHDSGELRFLEQLAGCWSQHVERRARRRVPT